MNPIALAIIALGVLLSLIGIVLIIKRMRIAGIIISLLGVGMLTFPFVIGLVLGPNP